ncbi:MAG: hypothetical protein PW845_16910 [Pseudomonas sp.]|nr:hypothetical protein [Pseudomonas sp.]
MRRARFVFLNFILASIITKIVYASGAIKTILTSAIGVKYYIALSGTFNLIGFEQAEDLILATTFAIATILSITFIGLSRKVLSTYRKQDPTPDDY